MLRFGLIITLWVFISSAAAQTCNSNIVESTPTSRFTINNDGTVLDNKTGLMWKQCLEGKSGSDCATGINPASYYNWQTALQVPEALNAGAGFAGYNDWRLPNIKELRSIVEAKCFDPAINLTVFPNNLTDFSVWTSTPSAYSITAAWKVRFETGETYEPFRFNTLHILLVRDDL